MNLFETKFSFEKVLTIRPGGDNSVSHAVTDLAWHRWAEAQPAAYEQHYENAYVTIEILADGCTATVQVATASINLQKARELYIGMKGVRCPLCLSDEIEGGPIEVDAGDAIQDITCGNCRSTWQDHYHLVRIDSLVVNEGRE